MVQKKKQKDPISTTHTAKLDQLAAPKMTVSEVSGDQVPIFLNMSLKIEKKQLSFFFFLATLGTKKNRSFF